MDAHMDAHIRTASDIIRTIQYITIATVTPDGLPWNTPVYCAYDADVQFFWISATTSQHAINLRSNPHAFVTVYDSTVPEGTGVGVYFAGQAVQIQDTRMALAAIAHLARRVHITPKHLSLFRTPSPRRLYLFRPDQAWINGWVESDAMKDVLYDVRVALDLAALRQERRFPHNEKQDVDG